MNRKPISRRAALAGMGAVGLSFNLPKGAFAASHSKTVNFYNWDTYIGETTLEDFTAATGIEVQYDLYADNDELFAKLKNGNPGYDLIVPTNDYVERMIVAEMLEPLPPPRLLRMPLKLRGTARSSLPSRRSELLKLNQNAESWIKSEMLLIWLFTTLELVLLPPELP